METQKSLIVIEEFFLGDGDRIKLKKTIIFVGTR